MCIHILRETFLQTIQRIAVACDLHTRTVYRIQIVDRTVHTQKHADIDHNNEEQYQHQRHHETRLE